MVFWRLIRFAMSKALASGRKIFFLETRQENKNVTAVIKYSGDVILRDQADSISKYLQGDSRELAAVNMEKGVLLALEILKKYSAHVNVSADEDITSIVITLPIKR